MEEIKLLEIIKQIAFKEIFPSYSLPTIVGINIEGTTKTGDIITSKYIKEFGEWLNDINIDDLSYSYKCGPFNLLRDNSLNDIFTFFMGELVAYYQERVADLKKENIKKKRKHKEALEAVLAKAEAQQALKGIDGKKKNTTTSDPVIAKINFEDDNDSKS